MKGFVKFLSITIAIFAAVFGALAVFDKWSNKNRIEGDYLDCDSDDIG